MGIDARTGRLSRLVVGAACAAAFTVGLPGAALAAPAVPPPPRQSAQPAAATPSTAAQAAPPQSADAAQRAHAAWETHGRPTALVVIRPTSVDLVDQGRLTRASRARAARSRWPG